MSARTRRQKAVLAATEAGSEEDHSAVLTPSKRTPSKKRARSATRVEPEENVFLFAPNLIGKSGRCEVTAAAVTQLVDSSLTRILPNRPGYRVPLLYAPPPTHLLPSL